MERFNRFELKTSLLKRWFDVDRPEDLKTLREQLASGEIVAVHTAEVLQRQLVVKGNPSGVTTTGQF